MSIIAIIKFDFLTFNEVALIGPVNDFLECRTAVSSTTDFIPVVW